MPTREAQAVINAAVPIAVRYALMKKHHKECPPQVILDGTGYLDVHENEGVDLTAELDNLLLAVLDLVE